MAWGYARGFVIEHDNTVKRKIDCKDCEYYELEDKSCGKRPLYLPEDGYNSWRNCDYFKLTPAASHYEEKKAQYAEFQRRKKNGRKEGDSAQKKEDKSHVTHKKELNIQKKLTISVQQDTPNKTPVNRGYTVVAYEQRKLRKDLRYEFIYITTDRSTKKNIKVAFDDLNKVAYVNKNVYTQEAIEKVRLLIP